MQTRDLLIRETQEHAHAGIFRHAQKVLAAAKSVPAAVLPATVLALSLPAEFTAAFTFKRREGRRPIDAPPPPN